MTPICKAPVLEGWGSALVLWSLLLVQDNVQSKEQEIKGSQGTAKKYQRVLTLRTNLRCQRSQCLYLESMSHFVGITAMLSIIPSIFSFIGLLCRAIRIRIISYEAVNGMQIA